MSRNVWLDALEGSITDDVEGHLILGNVIETLQAWNGWQGPTTIGSWTHRQSRPSECDPCAESTVVFLSPILRQAPLARRSIPIGAADSPFHDRDTNFVKTA